MGKQSTQGQKGNPAHKRMGNDKLKARRSASWTKGERRKEASRKAAEQRHRTNVASSNEASHLGQTSLTPWQTAKEARRERRAPLREAYSVWPKDRSPTEWEGSTARQSALQQGERIREAQVAHRAALREALS